MPSERPILHIVPAEPWGGIQALVPMLAREQIAQGQSVRLLCLGPGRRIREVAADYGLGDITQSFPGWRAPFRLLAILLRARGSVIHTHCEPIWASMVISATLPKRWIAHAHVYPDDMVAWKKRLSQRLHRHFASRHIAISQSIGRALLASGVATAGTVGVVHNGVAPLAFDPATPPATPPFTIGFVGRVVEEKGIFDFVALAALLADDGGLAFAVYGDGADISAARQQAVALGLSDRVVFHGYVDDMATAWRSIDLAIVFSRREPFGLVFLEAVQRGIPTISYENDSGGSEVAATLRSAQHVGPGDLTAAAAIVRAVAAAPRSLDAALTSDRETVERQYGIDTMARGVAAAYAKLDDHPA